MLDLRELLDGFCEGRRRRWAQPRLQANRYGGDAERKVGPRAAVTIALVTVLELPDRPPN